MKLVTRRVLTVILGCLGAIPLAAQTDGNMMLARDVITACTTPDMHWVDFCNGYVQALHDIGTELGEVCTTPNVTRTRLVELLTEEGAVLIVKDPSIGSHSGVVVGLGIISGAFPCPG